ncbi:MAG: ATP-binding protein [Magnetococcales bacterium]|nr:ATP-binding protein [Magnetococcales bacterium]
MARFRVMARTVDMLGQQQIAGIPTAISELFKNAHDAYARRVEVDYLREKDLFILRDDGLGMTREDFEQRWLTLGTDSKVAGGNLSLPPIDPEQTERPILGEKGIGRLAIAVLGPQVLVVTRAKRECLPSKVTVVAYLHWRLFALPGIDLDEVVIPLREIPGGTLPTEVDVRAMVQETIAFLDSIAHCSDLQICNKIREEMQGFTIDPSGLAQQLDTPSLLDDGCGTHFYITPVDRLMQQDIDHRDDDKKATRFEKLLIGFTNTMMPEHKPPVILTSFRDYIDEGAPIERIGNKAFFTPEEYGNADHHIIGRFDEYGHFSGKVGVYHLSPDPYQLSWQDSDGSPTACGPFEFAFAYLQGEAKESLLPASDHALLASKLDKIGGLYIYRNGIRVLPYGASDYDWLDIEIRRSKKASYYYYSYRRIFGAIELSTTKNSRLTEKAGREGFRENEAYRQLRSILIHFFEQSVWLFPHH